MINVEHVECCECLNKMYLVFVVFYNYASVCLFILMQYYYYVHGASFPRQLAVGSRRPHQAEGWRRDILVLELTFVALGLYGP